MKPLSEEQKKVLEQFDQLAKTEGSQNKACQKVGISSAIYLASAAASMRAMRISRYKS